jgi:hypothetical protein
MEDPLLRYRNAAWRIPNRRIKEHWKWSKASGGNRDVRSTAMGVEDLAARARFEAAVLSRFDPVCSLAYLLAKDRKFLRVRAAQSEWSGASFGAVSTTAAP